MIRIFVALFISSSLWANASPHPFHSFVGRYRVVSQKCEAIGMPKPTQKLLEISIIKTALDKAEYRTVTNWETLTGTLNAWKHESKGYVITRTLSRPDSRTALYEDKHVDLGGGVDLLRLSIRRNEDGTFTFGHYGMKKHEQNVFLNCAYKLRKQ